MEGVFLLNFMRAIISRKAARTLNEFARVALCVRRQEVYTTSLKEGENFNTGAFLQQKKKMFSVAGAGKLRISVVNSPNRE